VTYFCNYANKTNMIVMKFGGSSVKSEERIKAAADIILSQEDQKILVFSALGDTTDDLIEAGQKALNGEVVFNEIKDFHYTVASKLNVDTAVIDELLNELERLLSGIAMLGELSEKTNFKLNIHIIYSKYWICS
jgi:aspartokinase